MSYFSSLSKKMIVEGRVEDIQTKYPDLDVKEIAIHDPSPNKKYVAWMCKQLASGVSTNDLYPTVKSFDKNVNRIKNKDINSYSKNENRLRSSIQRLIEKHKHIAGSNPNEAYDGLLLDDPAEDEKSMYVPGDIKKKIKSWARDMKLTK